MTKSSPKNLTNELLLFAREEKIHKIKKKMFDYFTLKSAAVVGQSNHKGLASPREQASLESFVLLKNDYCREKCNQRRFSIVFFKR